MNCRGCGYPIIKFISLGQMPLANSFLEREQVSLEKKYDLSVGFCPKCYLAQLMDTIPPEELFSDYVYFSSTSDSFLKHCEESASYLSKKLDLNKQSLVLEIASNDGAQLQFFKNLGIQVLGIDPAKNIAFVANQKGIPTIAEFFNFDFANNLKTKKGIAADLIFGANVLAHVPQIVNFAKGVKKILKSKGSAVFEFPYVSGLMEGKFDTIYHEHVFYFSLIALINLFKTAGLELYDVEITPVQGGSLRIYVSLPGNFLISENVKNLVAQEIKNGFDKIETYQRVEEGAIKLKEKTLELLEGIKSRGKKIVAYSAPAKGNILLNYLGIGKNYLDFIVDKSKAKQGLYAPGTHLQVHLLEKIYQEKPDYLLILCWNILTEVINMPELQEYKKDGGKFIVLIPQIKVI